MGEDRMQDRQRVVRSGSYAVDCRSDFQSDSRCFFVKCLSYYLERWS